jgi:putative transposase
MFRYRLYPTKKQAQKLNAMLEECRWLYNHLLEKRRENLTHQHSRSIVNRFGVICVEDLTVKRMMHNHCLAKSIADASWSTFFAQLTAKAAEAGRQLVTINPAYTSQTCSRCGYLQPMPLDARVFDCPCCSAHLDRDLNAAVNILALGRQGRVIPEAPAL